MKTRVSFYTFGCRLNQAETATIENSFSGRGFDVVDFGEPADTVVVNTCTVTANGDADTRRLVNRIGREHPSAKIALVGCQAQIQQARLAELANVRWVVGNARKMDLAQIVIDNPDPDEAAVITPVIPRAPFAVAESGADRRHTRANLKIQDGCDFFCSFCVIPFARGRARSREFEDIRREGRALAAAGHREVVLTGVNIGTYADNGKSFRSVVAALEEIAGIDRIRISSIEPTTIPLELLDRMPGSVAAGAGAAKLCRHLHIPLQSGSDAVLSRMNRLYGAAEYVDFLAQVEARNPAIGLGTDIIVGFPGETDEDFAASVDVVRESPLMYVHVFSYSERERAKSRGFGDCVPAETIARRSAALRELSRRKRRLFHDRFAGATELVLFERRKDGWWTGLTDNYIRVKVRSDRDLTNQLAAVRLESGDDATMTGTV